MKRTAFFVSDGTGITAEALGEALLSLFDATAMERVRLPHVDCESAALAAAREIDAAATRDGIAPIVIATVADPALRDRIGRAACQLLDVFSLLLPAMEDALGQGARRDAGRTHVARHETQAARVAAMHYALANDDGASGSDYAAADVILVGVSRSGKTPCCLYLALQFGVRAANYPVTEDDLDRGRLPSALMPHIGKLCALGIEPARLAMLREQRQPGSGYASQARCEEEVRQANALLARHHVPIFDTTRLSIEETATRVMQLKGLAGRRR